MRAHFFFSIFFHSFAFRLTFFPHWHSHNFLCFSVTIFHFSALSPTHTRSRTHSHSLVEKWEYLYCQVCSQRCLWPQTEIGSLLRHGGYSDKGAPNIYFLICPLHCHCCHPCQLSRTGRSDVLSTVIILLSLLVRQKFIVLEGFLGCGEDLLIASEEP